MPKYLMIRGKATRPSVEEVSSTAPLPQSRPAASEPASERERNQIHDQHRDRRNAVGQGAAVQPLAEHGDARHRHEDQLPSGGQWHRARHAEHSVGAQLVAYAQPQQQARAEGHREVERRPLGVQERRGHGGHEEATQDRAHDALAV